jgi:Protein of unknown function (DUF3274)
MSDTSPSGNPITLARGQASFNSQKDTLSLHSKKALPGVVIYVHGVNSDGEWFEDAEQGLCTGLNARLKRQPQHVAMPEHVGQLQPNSYTPELTPKGFVDDKLSARTFVKEANYSPVIRFRWGYRASKSDKDTYGTTIWLNEKDAWGGGPFANGCTALADCWTNGLDDALLPGGALAVSDINPVPGRDVFACPPRHYYAHAAWRLATLIAFVRKQQPDLPVTVVCHSQGNMVTIASAFVGDAKLGGKGVADTYVLCNPPYNLALGLTDGLVDTYTQEHLGGRVTAAARIATFKKFLAIAKKRKGKVQTDADIDQLTGNEAPKDGSKGFTAANNRAKTTDGSGNHDNYGRVYLYCNPHDQVIGSSPVQGIGWKGVSYAQFDAVGGAGVLYQRVWAQAIATPDAPASNWKVGDASLKKYHYWHNHWLARARHEYKGFWYPEAPKAAFQLRTADQAPVKAADYGVGQGNKLQRAGAAIYYKAARIVRDTKQGTVNGIRSAGFSSINGIPENDWAVPVNAPAVPEPIVPKAKGLRAGETYDDLAFDQGKEAERQQLAVKPDRALAADTKDPYHDKRAGANPATAPQGTAETEASLRYEHNARLRMAARRSGDKHLEELADTYDGKHAMDAKWDSFAKSHIADYLSKGVGINATDHSSILTNPMHSEKVLSYDVAVGYAALKDEVWQVARRIADWRWVPEDSISGIEIPEQIVKYAEYYRNGTLNNKKELPTIPEYLPPAARELGIEDTRSRTLQPLIDTYDATKKGVNDGIDATQEAAIKAKNAAVDAAEATKKAAVEAAEAAKKAAIEAAEAAKKTAIETAKAAKEAALDAADATKQAALKAAQMAEQKAAELAKLHAQVASKALDTASAAISEAERIGAKGWDYVSSFFKN